MKKEIEHKWLISFNDAFKIIREKDLDTIEMYQAYIISEDFLEVRLRVKNEPENKSLFFITAKSGGGLVRDEKEIEISKELFNSLSVYFLKGKVDFIRKALHEVGKIEMSIVDFNEFTCLEVEFESEEEAENFTFEEPFKNLNLELITENQDYKMKNYWNRTRGKTAIKEDELKHLISVMRKVGFESEWIERVWEGRNR